MKAVWACLLFSYLNAVAIRMQHVALPDLGMVPVQWIQARPYLLTVVLVAGCIGHTVTTQALDMPYL